MNGVPGRKGDRGDEGPRGKEGKEGEPGPEGEKGVKGGLARFLNLEMTFLFLNALIPSDYVTY